ncbi:hypothetical protein LINPERPRIM_LOCUS44079, partial [Linum perenne]
KAFDHLQLLLLLLLLILTLFSESYFFSVLICCSLGSVVADERYEDSSEAPLEQGCPRRLPINDGIILLQKSDHRKDKSCLRREKDHSNEDIGECGFADYVFLGQR